MTSIVQGIVIGQKIVRDNDIFVTFYSREKGRIELMARGAKKISSKMKNHLEILNEVKLMMAAGKNYTRLASVDGMQLFPKIRKDYQKTILALMLVEVASQLIEEEEPDERIYNLLLSWFQFLEKYSGVKYNKLELAAWLSIWKLLIFLGYGPQVKSCVRCGQAIKPNKHFFSLLAGGLVCSACYQTTDQEISLGAVKMIRYFLAEPDLDKVYTDFDRIKFDQDLRRELLVLLKDFSEYIIGKKLSVWQLLNK